MKLTKKQAASLILKKRKAKTLTTTQRDIRKFLFCIMYGAKIVVGDDNIIEDNIFWTWTCEDIMTCDDCKINCFLKRSSFGCGWLDKYMETRILLLEKHPAIVHLIEWDTLDCDE